MLLWRERLTSVPIMSLQTGGQLAKATEPIIDPRSLKIVAFYCEGPLIDFNPAVLHVDDIREFGEIGLIINDSDDIMPLSDLVRLQKIIDYNFDLIGKKVIDTTNNKLGKVNNYVTDSGSFQITKFSVKRPLLHSLQQSELIINRQQIRKITDDEIVVSAPTVDEKTETVIRPNPIDNPFRQHHRPVENSNSK